MEQKEVWRTIFLVTFVICQMPIVLAQSSGRDPAQIIGSENSIQVTVHVKRSPIGTEHGELTTADTVEVNAGDLWMEDKDKDDSTHPRRWGFWGRRRDQSIIFGKANHNCELNVAFFHGKKVAFKCGTEATWLVVVQDTPPDEASKEGLDNLYPTEIGTADEHEAVWLTNPKLKFFSMENYDYTDPQKPLVRRAEQTAQSDPFEIKSTTDCYFWNYRLSEIKRIGYIFREGGPSGGSITSSAYILMELQVWIVESNAVTESEMNPATALILDIADYSKFLTRRFNSRGMIPCLRKVHPSVELVSEADFKEESDSPEFPTPHWTMRLKIHTNTLISTFSDVSFTIASRQHIASFHCSIGNTKVYVNVRDFDFIKEGQSDRYEVRWNISVVPKTVFDYLALKVEHIYGHPTVYVGEARKSSYQPGDRRTDMVVISNPCITQEFAIAAAGRIYIIEKFLEDFYKNAISIVLPGLGSLDAKNDDGTFLSRHDAFVKVSDVAFTPTHVVILMEDSSIYLHSPSAFSQGIAYLPSTKKNRFEAFVKRRWCARTGTPKMSNMMVPAYSSTGNIALLQIFPVEGAAKMWINDPSEACAAVSPELFKKTIVELAAEVNESCVHMHEAVSRRDERGLEIEPEFNETMCEELLQFAENEEEEDPETKLTFLMNQGRLLSDSDPHFPEHLRNMAVYKIDDSSSEAKFYNKVITFHLDEGEIGDKNLEKTLRRNGITTTEPITLHSVEFTAVEKKYLAGIEFEADEFRKGSVDDRYEFTMIICTITAKNMPSKIYPLEVNKEETLDTDINFPGVILVRSLPHMMKNANDPTGKPAPYIVKLFPINTAIPAYVVDLGNVYVFSSVETKYARPLTFFKREDIHEIITCLRTNSSCTDDRKILKDSQRLSVFTNSTAKPCTSLNCTNEDPATELFDIVVTEQAVVSILNRRPMIDDNPTPNPPVAVDPSPKHRVFVGSLVTLDSLREIRPFTKFDDIFQMSTPDGDIVYGKYKKRAFSSYPECDAAQFDEINKDEDILTTCLMPHNNKTEPPYCTFSGAEGKCTDWEFINNTQNGDLSLPKPVIGFCGKNNPKKEGCIVIAKGQSGLPPENVPKKDIPHAKILPVPFHSLLNGNLQLVPEEKISVSGIVDSDDVQPEERQCPFADFNVQYINFNFVEIGFMIRMTAEISYLGKNVPSEADIIIDHDSLPGIRVEISSSVIEENDQTTIQKTVDIIVKLSDIALHRMRTSKLQTTFRDTTNLAREVADEFSITFRPTIVNLRCDKEDFFITVHYPIGCDPLSKMRFIPEAAPLIRKQIKDEKAAVINKDLDWIREGDFLTVPKIHVWHKQRELFHCPNKTVPKPHRCKVPYAYLFGNNIFEISWRDPLVPRFEQFLRSHTRKVTANIVIYDLFGRPLSNNISTLEAGCFNTGGEWYDKLLASTGNIGTDTSEQEDVYQYYVDCFDRTLGREKPQSLANTEFRLYNRTNNNSMSFDLVSQAIRTKNRNQLLLLRAAVINTENNRFTYCKLMDTFFLLRVVGIPTPRQGIHPEECLYVLIGLLICMIIIYFAFSKYYTWKLDVPAISTVDVENKRNQRGNELEGSLRGPASESTAPKSSLAGSLWRTKALSSIDNTDTDKGSTASRTTITSTTASTAGTASTKK